MQVKDGVPIEQGMVDLERVLRREHKIRPGGENDFTIRDQQDVLATQQQATQVFTSLLAGVAAVSLVVGGIGARRGRPSCSSSVTEHTVEWVPGKPWGQPSGRMLQFLIEALTYAWVASSMLLGHCDRDTPLQGDALEHRDIADGGRYRLCLQRAVGLSSASGQRVEQRAWTRSSLSDTNIPFGVLRPSPKVLPTLLQLSHESDELWIAAQPIEGPIGGESG